MALSSLYRTLEALEAERVLLLSHAPAGLQAVLVLDDRTLGPPLIELRVASFTDASASIADASKSARAMSLKCSLAGLDAGGAALVVQELPGLDRTRAMGWLSRELQTFGGAWTVAGMGASARDMRLLAQGGASVDPAQAPREAALTQGVLRCLTTLAEHRGKTLEECSFAIQGAGPIAQRLAEVLSAVGGDLIIADHDPALSRQLADSLGARMVPAHGIWSSEVDILVPCAQVGLIGPKILPQIRAWGVCGASTAPLADLESAEALHQMGILAIPGMVSCLGGLAQGLDLGGPGLSLDELAMLVEDLLDESQRTGRAPRIIAEERAWERIELAG
ncbi:MAG: leucine dehydrogenase [Cognaticolwellia sp.]|jgi:leucine dehydrogenase